MGDPIDIRLDQCFKSYGKVICMLDWLNQAMQKKSESNQFGLFSFEIY